MSPLQALLQAALEDDDGWDSMVRVVKHAIEIEAASEEAKPGSSVDSVKTPAERTAGITPLNPGYPPGDIRRYGAQIDGATDDTEAWVTAGNGCVIRGSEAAGWPPRLCPKCKRNLFRGAEECDCEPATDLTDEQLGEIQRKHEDAKSHWLCVRGKEAHADRGVLLAEIERLRK